MEKRRILVVEDDCHMMGFLKSALEQRGFVPFLAPDCERALRILARNSTDLAILDYKLSQEASGLELAKLIRRQDSRLPVIIITGYSTEDLAIQALKEGINDYFPKPFQIEELLASIDRLLHPAALGTSPAPAGVPDITPELIDGHLMVGESRVMRDVRQFIRSVGRSDSSVLILGETGTGKELVADLIHMNSGRAAKPFIRLNCAAIPDPLLESELFGYERGAFTGAYATQEGKLKLADGGTVLLDEIGDMSLSTQAKMLRVLDRKAIQRVGGRKDVTLNLRIIAATNKNLEELMASGRFRRDLYFRLNVTQVVLPLLRERKEDIPLLLRYFIDELNQRVAKEVEGVSQEVLAHLLKYDWPGNVRELKNVVEACLLSVDSGTIRLADIAEPYRQRLEAGVTGEKELLLSVLFSTKWNKSRAAKELHWSRMTVYRKMAKYHLMRRGGNNEQDRPMISEENRKVTPFGVTRQ